MQKFFSALIALIVFALPLCAQDDLLNMLEAEADSALADEKVLATFKTTKIVNAQSTETVKKGTLDFRITHRFGNMGAKSNGGWHTLWGFDAAENIRFSFDYGITERIQLGFGRSKTKEHLDWLIKAKALEQTANNKVPVTVVLYADAAFTPQRDIEKRYSNWQHRLSYTFQSIIGRKFSERFSFEVLPTLVHRNQVIKDINENNNSEEDNDLFAIGFGARLKVTKRMAFVADYFYDFSDYRTGNKENPFYNPLGIGVEIETGGHVFHINLTNASGIIEADYLPETRDTWTKGGYKMGFNISRVFGGRGRKHKHQEEAPKAGES